MRRRIVITVLLIISLTLIFLGAIKERIKASSVRPVVNYDMRRLKDLFYTFMAYNDKKYPPVSYEEIKADSWPVMKRDFDKLESALRKEAGIFFQDTLASEKNNAGSKGEELKFSIRSGENKIILPDDRGSIEGFSIKNDSEDFLRGLIFTFNGRDWSSVGSIIAEAKEKKYSEEEKALFIWKLLSDNITHFDVPYVGYCYDPVMMLNVTGYGKCDDMSGSFIVLARALGLKSRAWFLTGHVVPEVYYNNAWHMLDSDQGVFYLARDGNHIAGVEEIAKDAPYLIGRTPEPKYSNKERFIKVYSTEQDNEVVKNFANMVRLPGRVEFDLLPGEELSFLYSGSPLWYVFDYLSRPPSVGMVTDTINIADRKIFGYFENYGMGFDGEAIKTHADKAFVISSQRLPYPILDARLELDCEGVGYVETYFSRDGNSWTRVGVIEGCKGSISFKRMLNNFNALPDYRYYIKTVFPAGVTIKNFIMKAYAQANPRGAFPLTGGENTIEFVGAEAAELEFSVRFSGRE